MRKNLINMWYYNAWIVRTIIASMCLCVAAVAFAYEPLYIWPGTERRPEHVTGFETKGCCCYRCKCGNQCLCGIGSRKCHPYQQKKHEELTRQRELRAYWARFLWDTAFVVVVCGTTAYLYWRLFLRN